MGRFFDRYLPSSERRTALWLAFGGAAVQSVALRAGSAGDDQASPARRSGRRYAGLDGAHRRGRPRSSRSSRCWSQRLIRFARAPRALALYLLAGRRCGLVLVGLAGLGRCSQRTAQYLGVGAGRRSRARGSRRRSRLRASATRLLGRRPERRRAAAPSSRERGWAFLGWEGGRCRAMRSLPWRSRPQPLLAGIAALVGALRVRHVRRAGSSAGRRSPSMWPVSAGCGARVAHGAYVASRSHEPCRRSLGVARAALGGSSRRSRSRRRPWSAVERHLRLARDAARLGTLLLVTSPLGSQPRSPAPISRCGANPLHLLDTPDPQDPDADRRRPTTPQEADDG